MRAKERAGIEIGLDIDSNVLGRSDLIRKGINLIHDDGISYLEKYPFEGHEVVYCDPPYLPITRKRASVYRHDLSENDHLRFLDVISKLNAKILISGYDNQIYREYLKGWNVYSFSSKAHDGIRQEYLWYNYDVPSKLHDYRYLGSNFRERQTIRRRLQRIQSRLSSLSTHERSFILQWLQNMECTYAD